MEGVDTFKAYCVSCHGPQAKGDGPAAVALKKMPADLTTIAKRNGGKFSASDVEDIIMGTSVMASHGSREMPIWGPVFQSLAPDTSVVKLRVSNLVELHQVDPDSISSGYVRRGAGAIRPPRATVLASPPA